MPIDPNIAMGYRPPQIEMPDVQNARAAQVRAAEQQAMLGQMQMTELARANQQKNAMRDILSKAPEGAPTSEINRLIEKSLISGGDVAGLIAHRKALAEAEAAQANVLKAKAQTKQAEAGTAEKEFDLNKKKFTHAWESVSKSATPSEFKANIYDALSKKYITQEEADGGLARLEQAQVQDSMAGGNTNFMRLRMESLEKLLPTLDAIKLNEPKYEYINLHGKQVRVQTNRRAPGFDATQNELAVTSTPHELELEKLRKQELGIAYKRLKEDYATGSLDPQTLDFAAQGYIQDQKLPELGSGKAASAIKTAILKRAADLSMAGGITAEQAAGNVLSNKAERMGEKSGQRAVGTQIANIQVAANEANKMINVARPYVDKVNPSDYPTINAVGNYVASKTGDPNITGLTTSLNSLVNIYARAINPKGVATVSDKNHAREIINTAMAKGQLNEAFKVMQAEMDAALASGPETKAALRKNNAPAAPTGAVDTNNKWLKSTP